METNELRDNEFEKEKGWVRIEGVAGRTEKGMRNEGEKTVEGLKNDGGRTEE